MPQVPKPKDVGVLSHERKPIRPNRLKDVKFAKTTRVEKKLIK